MLLTYAENCVKPANDYFKEKFDNDLRSTVELFKTARYFSPSKVSELKPTSSDLNSLSIFPFLILRPSKVWSQSCLHAWLLQKMYHYRLTLVNGGSTTVQIYQCGQEPSEKWPLSNLCLQQQRESFHFSKIHSAGSKKNHLKTTYNYQWWCSTTTETNFIMSFFLMLHETSHHFYTTCIYLQNTVPSWEQLRNNGLSLKE